MKWPWSKKPESGVEPFDTWEIATVMPDESQMDLHGYVYSHMDPAEVLRYVEAIAEGLRSAGFPSEVSIVRENRSKR